MDPRWLDPSLEPNQRKPGRCFLGDPRVANNAPTGLARFCSAKSWLSQARARTCFMPRGMLHATLSSVAVVDSREPRRWAAAHRARFRPNLDRRERRRRWRAAVAPARDVRRVLGARQGVWADRRRESLLRRPAGPPAPRRAARARVAQHARPHACRHAHGGCAAGGSGGNADRLGTPTRGAAQLVWRPGQDAAARHQPSRIGVGRYAPDVRVLRRRAG